MAKRTKEELQEIAAEVIEDILSGVDKSDVADSMNSFGYTFTDGEIGDIVDEIRHVELSMRFDGLR